MQTEDYQYLYDLEARFWWFTGMRAISAALLAPYLPQTSARMILDAGCGTGGNLEWLRRYAGNGTIIGLDYVGTALQFCRQAGHENLVQASATHLPFADATFDLVTSFDVLVQLPGDGADEQAIREMYRALKPGGLVFVRAAAYQWMRSGHDKALNSQRRYTLSELQQKLERAGFIIKRATYANSLLLPVAALRRLVLKRLGVVDAGSDVKPLSPQLQWLNDGLAQMLHAEANWLRARRLPCGLSAICVAEKLHG
jgi:ubiquinone/menaquinone biosynthesis C-methylase UbiE